MNGCSYVPNTLFNEEACNIHDLCYITPGASKKECDDTFVDNILRIYCDNVNVLERLACTGKYKSKRTFLNTVMFTKSRQVEQKLPSS